ncbi:MAG TPA: permease-like cell division protein FtsX [Noviherbaspirillum sp.]|uniref:permease-like cell division protein FtsX n=1 Tax=Noviherbaspirillum sp. TaxID=1926288 RepID=UPI002D35ED56|nr:permease-like cell division protein FtsX [Noviherbaspirillum sp.]HYD93776.1 permease-like cell division protein FtsX [Noviherbaspirillum sp.]
MTTWLRQHLVALADAFKHLARAPGSFALNVLVVAIALALPFAGLTLLENVRPVSEQLAVEPEISVFLAVDTPRERATALAPQIRRSLQESGRNGKIEFIPREHALNLLKNKSGIADAITALGENPLPDGYVLKLSGVRTGEDAARVDALAAQLKALPGVEYVQIDSAWVKRLAALMQVLRLALLFLAGTLAVVVVAVVFNTIRLQVMTQRDEIEVCRMFGATNAYICRPFYYTGALLGLCAGLLALGAVAASLQPLNSAVAEFARLYASEFRLTPLGSTATVAMLAMSAGLGLLGALLSVRRHLAKLA